MSYKVFHAADFVTDETFIKFVERSDSNCISDWEEWIIDHPENKEEFDKAKEIVEALLNNKRIPLINLHKKEFSQKLITEIEKTEKKAVRIYSRLWQKVAASLIFLISVSYLWYFLSINNQGASDIAYNEVYVPTGEKSQVILSDGTHIWINSGSRLKYPVEFNNETRNVYLEGEAYFEVTKQNGSVFKVYTKNTEIEVLGTSFNVNAYPDDDETRTTVIEGLVSMSVLEEDIEPIVIKPNQVAILKDAKLTVMSRGSENSKEIRVIDKINTSPVTSWKDHLLVFDDETFEDIAVKMERWFNVEILIEDEYLKQQRYTGKFIHNETVYQVLEIIKTTTPLEYIFKENEITIIKDNS